MSHAAALRLIRNGLFSLLALAFGARAPAAPEWTAQEGHRWTAVSLGEGSRVGFTELPPPTTGIFFTNSLPAERFTTNQILLNGSGVAAGDIDGDGDLDLLVNSVGVGTMVFLNDSQGRFSLSPRVPLLNRRQCGTSLALADMDGDGWLDLYIANYRVSTVRDQPALRFAIKTSDGQPRIAGINGRPLTDPEWTNRFDFRVKMLPDGGATVLHDEHGEPDALFRNLGAGRFAPVPFTGGTFLDERGVALSETPLDWGSA